MQNEGGSNFELPIEQPPTPEQQPDQAQERAVEQQRPAKQEAGVGKAAPKPKSTDVTDVMQAPPVQVTVPSEPADQPTAGPVSPATKDLKADNADLIEKEWVERAKTIVAKTHDDPHKQKDEMSKVKADYIQKRFKKSIKTDETAVA